MAACDTWVSVTSVRGGLVQKRNPDSGRKGMLMWKFAWLLFNCGFSQSRVSAVDISVMH